ncbi:MAG TPA: phage major capsid protein [Hypericibacter adhaerens]|uniref:phage major capsid protein n=1 Tax=Hypericibacter adhaerens TaxID=2602016 RepID=UPI002C425CDB|nr:phage major capsid protein [Hypericibacter adhaerens]HWA42164.1 phage major capsid protein [Hypericibacter adhaerens]
MTELTSGLENKAGTGIASGDTEALVAQLMNAFEEFKHSNEQRLAQIERRGSADALTVEKVERLNAALDGAKAALDRASLERARPRLEGGRPDAGDEYKEAFAAYVKRGEEKALSIGVNADGGYLVPTETDTEITRLMTALSPIRAISSVRQVSTALYRRPVTTAGPATGWVAETDARPQTASQTIDALSFPTAELYAMPAATSAFLEDAAVDVGQWIADEVNAAFAQQEGAAFVNGNGVNKPKGFLSETTVAEASWSWGKLGYIATGVSGDFPASDQSDALVDLVYALKAGYRQNASFVMNRRTQAAIRKLKDDSGNYIWQPAATADGRATLMGFPLVEAEDMPDIGANAMAIAFGDFRRGYLVVDRRGVNVLRDPYSAKPYVLFYTTKRVGGGVQNYDAIKLMKFAAS